MPDDPSYTTSARVVQAEGARVGFVTCTRCGVTLLLDPDIPLDVLATHDEFHKWLAKL
jgi:hypothetical protein